MASQKVLTFVVISSTGLFKPVRCPLVQRVVMMEMFLTDFLNPNGLIQEELSGHHFELMDYPLWVG